MAGKKVRLFQAYALDYRTASNTQITDKLYCLQDMPVVKTERFNGTIGGVTLDIQASHYQTYPVKMEFDFCGRQYKMGVWLPQGINAAMYFFHEHYNPPTAVFGDHPIKCETADNSGKVKYTSTATQEQKQKVMIKICEDVIGCIDKIFAVHQGSILNHATWQREHEAEEPTYRSFITFRALHCIVHSKMMAPMTHVTPIHF